MPILIVPPLSGQFPALLRDMVIDLAETRSVYVIDWRNPRFIPLSAGHFDVATSVDCILSAIAAIGPAISLVGLCQSVVPVLIAAAKRADAPGETSVRQLVLIGGPVDPHANLNGTASVIRSLPLWVYDHWISTVPWPYPGIGRRVFPAGLRLVTLALYAARHTQPFDPVFCKLLLDDGVNPLLTPFASDYFNTVDLPAEWLLETLQTVYLTSREDSFWQRYEVPLSALSKTRLMTVEGGRDDVAAPGQTHAAHDLCGSASHRSRTRLTIDRAGHFDLFHGRLWRREVAPAILEFLDYETEPASATLPSDALVCS